MALLPILKYPHPNLHVKADPVSEVTPEIAQTASDMLATMYESKGIGLAATQVDIQQRLFVMDISEEGNEPQVFINPQITWFSEELQEYEEGCLSIPGIYDKVTRPAAIKGHATNEKGERFEFDYEGLKAVCVQHEIDHLDGVLFIDHLSKLKQNRIKTKIKKAQKEAAKNAD
ncbi:peptide deformylase [Brackiella oedipodis]|uniref:peptide deformylase n=1 Tax=Brackiella oedipodis TaxID=124225 RepID=UPI00048A9C2A|nr:peptide deformylase [Brackiella oedipodis]